MFIKSLRFETTWVRKKGFYKNVFKKSARFEGTFLARVARFACKFERA